MFPQRIFDLTVSVPIGFGAGTPSSNCASGVVNYDWSRCGKAWLDSSLTQFARAVFEMSNGVHVIGRVHIIQDSLPLLQGDFSVFIDSTQGSTGGRSNTMKSQFLALKRAPVFMYARCYWKGMKVNSPLTFGATLAHEWGHSTYGLGDEYYYGRDNNLHEAAHAYYNIAWPSLMSNQEEGIPWSWNFSDSNYSTRFDGGPRPLTMLDTVIGQNITDSFYTNADESYGGLNTWEYLTTPNDSLHGAILHSPFYPELRFFRDQRLSFPLLTTKPDSLWHGVLKADGTMDTDTSLRFPVNGIYPILNSIYESHALDHFETIWVPQSPGWKRVYLIDQTLDVDGKGLFADFNASSAMFMARLLSLGEHQSPTNNNLCEVGLVLAYGENSRSVVPFGDCHLQAKAVSDSLSSLSKPRSYTQVLPHGSGKGLSAALSQARNWFKLDSVPSANELVIVTRGFSNISSDPYAGLLVRDGVRSVLQDLESAGVRLRILSVGDSASSTRFSIFKDWYSYIDYREYLPLDHLQARQQLSMSMSLNCSRNHICIPQKRTISSQMPQLGNLYVPIDSLAGALPAVVAYVKGKVIGWTTSGSTVVDTIKSGVATKVFPYKYGWGMKGDAWILFSSPDSNLFASSNSWSGTFYKNGNASFPQGCDSARVKGNYVIWCKIRDGSSSLLALYDSIFVQRNSLDTLVYYTFSRSPQPDTTSSQIGSMAFSSSGFGGRVAYPWPVQLEHTMSEERANANPIVRGIVVDAGGAALDTVAMKRSFLEPRYVGQWSGYQSKGLYQVEFLHGDSIVDETSFLVDQVPSDDYGTCDAPQLVDGAQWLRGRSDWAGDQDCFQVRMPADSANVVLRLADLVGIPPQIQLRTTQGSWIDASTLQQFASPAGYSVYLVPAAWAGQSFFVQISSAGSKPTSWSLGIGPLAARESPREFAQIQSLDKAGSSAVHSEIALRIQNTGADTLRDFRLRYYFSTENFREPQVDDWWSAFCAVRRIQLGQELWAVELDYAGTKLAPGASLSINPDHAVGVHYPDWSSWSKSNDWSNLPGGEFQANPRIGLFNAQGVLLQGEIPTPGLATPREPQHSVRVLTRDEKWYDAPWSGPNFRIENMGDSLTDFRVEYYFHEDGILFPPILWQGPCVLHLDTLGHGDYRLVLDYHGVTLLPNQANVWVADALVGLHLENWGSWNKQDDYSISSGASWAVNPRVEVFDNSGIKIYGNRE